MSPFYSPRPKTCPSQIKSLTLQMQNKIIQNNNHTFMNFVEELKWRGMIHQMMPGTEEQLQKEMTVAYLGIDPTADSLHIGHLVGVMMLKHLQRAGHKPIALVGGATGMIGDPSMKSQERKLIDEKTLRHNQEHQAAARQIPRLRLDRTQRGRTRQQLRLDETVLVSRLHPRRRQAHHRQLHDGKGLGQEASFGRKPAGNVVHRILLSTRTGLRLPLPIPRQGMPPAARRIRSVGQHHHRHRTHTPHSRR